MEVIAGRDDRDINSLSETKLEYLRFLEGDLKGLRVGWSPDLGYAMVDPEVLAITTTSLGIFESLGAEVEDAGLELENQGRTFSIIWGVTIASEVADKLEEWRDKINPRLVEMVERGMNVRAVDYAYAAQARKQFWVKIQPLFEEYDVLLTPTLSVPAFDINEYQVTEIAGVKGSPALDWTPFTYPFNFTGQPAASLPCGWTEAGLPVGLQIVGGRFADATVLKVAAAFEKASPWADKYPPLD